MNEKYHMWVESSNAKLDRAIRILGALAGSSAVAGFAIWKEPWGTWIWGILTGIAALANTIGAAAPPGDRARKHAELRQRYTSLRYAWESLRDRIERLSAQSTLNPSHEQFDRLKEERARIALGEPPVDRAMLQKARDEVVEETTPVAPRGAGQLKGPGV